MKKSFFPLNVSWNRFGPGTDSYNRTYINLTGPILFQWNQIGPEGDCFDPDQFGTRPELVF